MKVKSLSLTNFRNYNQLLLNLSPQMNVLLGDNAQGKTNLLEGLSFLSSLRSFRVNSESQLINFEKEYSRIQCEIEKKISSKTLSVFLSKEGKSLMINDTIIKKSSDFIGELNTVLFEPSDLGFFEDAPKVRRRFIDIELTKLSQFYLNHVNDYSKILKQRNAYLKQIIHDDDTLDILDQQLVRHHVEIVLKRKEFINELNQKLQSYFSKLSKTDAKLELVYKTDVYDENKEKLSEVSLEKLKINRQRDLYFKITHFGCHRDDIISLFNGNNLSQVASQGQKRLVLLSMKLALIDYIVKTLDEKPILLLDDVFSELDKYHQKQFLKLCPDDIQTIITTTSLVSLDILDKEITVFNVKNGSISQGGIQ